MSEQNQTILYLVILNKQKHLNELMHSFLNWNILNKKKSTNHLPFLTVPRSGWMGWKLIMAL